MSVTFITPVGRVVQGSVHTPQTTDQQGKPLVYKSGANMGQPREEFFFALAIDKQNPEWPAFWQVLQSVADQSFPNGEHRKQGVPFSWKVKDGDGFDQNGRPNFEKPGQAGHWIVSFTSSFASSVVKDGQIVEPKTVRTGDYIRVSGNASGNGGGRGQGPQKPGIYLNPNAIEFVGWGEEIKSGPDPREAFANAAKPAYLPPGMSTTAPMGGHAAVAAAPAGPGTVPVSGTVGHSFANPTAAGPGATAAGPGAGGPGAGYSAPPALPGAAAAPAAPACPLGAPAGFRMKNPGPTYASFKATPGWTDELMLQHGHMERV